MSYTPIYSSPYPDGWQDGYGLTEVNADFLNMLEKTVIGIEEYLKENVAVFPVNEDGSVNYGTEGQFPISNGDGTVSWVSLDIAEGGAY